MTKAIQSVTSPNFAVEEIPVEFLVLHYTACTLQETLRIFTTPERQVCAHFVVDLDGTIYDLGGFWDGPIRRGAHAGVSHFILDGKKWESFNRFAVGVEIVNFNGNIFSYTDAQYEALTRLTQHLGRRFPALRLAERIVGHEQVAGFRGKADPGVCFDWKRFYGEALGVHGNLPDRTAVLNPHAWAAFEKQHGPVKPDQMSEKDWSVLSSNLEKFVAQLQSIKSS